MDVTKWDDEVLAAIKSDPGTFGVDPEPRHAGDYTTWTRPEYHRLAYAPEADAHAAMAPCPGCVPSSDARPRPDGRAGVELRPRRYIPKGASYRDGPLTVFAGQCARCLQIYWTVASATARTA